MCGACGVPGALPLHCLWQPALGGPLQCLPRFFLHTELEANLKNQKELLTAKEMEVVFSRLEQQNPSPKPELLAPNPYCFLVSVVLSAQATDKSVNVATAPLYKKVKSPKQMLALGRDGLIGYIKSIGLYNSKADHILALSKKLIEEFNSEIPQSREELMSLPGVGRKTANVVLNAVFNQPTMPVDTHLLRVCPKTGIASGSTPEQVEQSLLERVPKKYLLNAHHWLLLHGRYTCTARSPKCGGCIISDLCLFNRSLSKGKKD